MAPLTQPITNVIGFFAVVLALALIPTTLLALLMRMLRWLGFDAFDPDDMGGE